MLNFNLTIGDWSGDGHSMSKVFLCTTEAKDIQDVREAHFKMKRVFGFSIENLCSEYEEGSMSECEIEDLIDHGLITEDQAKEYSENVTPRQMVELWLEMLNRVDPSLHCDFADKGVTVPDLHFYGYDNKKRHINFVGYGIFGH